MTPDDEQRLHKLKEAIANEIARHEYYVTTLPTKKDNDEFIYSFDIENLDEELRWAFKTLPENLRQQILTEWGMTYEEERYHQYLRWTKKTITIPELVCNDDEQFIEMYTTLVHTITEDINKAPEIIFSRTVKIEYTALTPKKELPRRVLKVLREQYPMFDIFVQENTNLQAWMKKFGTHNVLFYITGIKPQATVSDIHQYLLDKVEMLNAYGYRELKILDYLPKNYIKAIEQDARQNEFISYFRNAQSDYNVQQKQDHNGLELDFHNRRLISWSRDSYELPHKDTPQKRRLQETYQITIEDYSNKVLNTLTAERDKVIAKDPTAVVYVVEVKVPNDLIDSTKVPKDLTPHSDALWYVEEKLLKHGFRDITIRLFDNTFYIKALHLPLMNIHN